MGVETKRNTLTCAQQNIEQCLVEELLLFAKVNIPSQFIAGSSFSLIKKFGGVAGVLHAPRPELEKLLGAQKRCFQLMDLILRFSSVLSRPVDVDVTSLHSRARLMDYIYTTMAFMEIEHCRILYLNKRNHLLVDEVAWTGTVDHVKGYPREIIKRALEIGATALVVAHNHPSGDPKPSADDIWVTRHIAAAARPFNIFLHDHVIVGRQGHCSMRQLNLLGGPAGES